MAGYLFPLWKGLCQYDERSGKGGKDMSCSVCAGHDSYNCPCCSPKVQIMTCPECDNGYQYYAFDVIARKFVRVTELAYQILPFDEDDAYFEKKRYCQGCIEKCRKCNGEGEIPHC